MSEQAAVAFAIGFVLGITPMGYLFGRLLGYEAGLRAGRPTPTGGNP